MVLLNVNKNLLNEIDKDIEACQKVIKNEYDMIKKYEQEIAYIKERIQQTLQKDLRRKIRARAMYIGVGEEEKPKVKKEKKSEPKIEMTVVDEDKMAKEEIVEDVSDESKT